MEKADNDLLNYRWIKGTKEVFPSHRMVENWLFTEDTEDEAILAHQLAVVAEKNGLNANDLQHLFPAVLRMLKSNINWSK